MSPTQEIAIRLELFASFLSMLCLAWAVEGFEVQGASYAHVGAVS